MALNLLDIHTSLTHFFSKKEVSLYSIIHRKRFLFVYVSALSLSAVAC